MEDPGAVTELRSGRDGTGRHVVVDCDDLALRRDAADEFLAVIRRNEERFSLSTRWSTNAFLRRRLGHQFSARDLYGNVDAKGRSASPGRSARQASWR